MKVLELKRVEKTYRLRRFFGREKKLRVLRGISLELFENEVLGLVGESGCGKSTLARVALALEPPDAGEVLFRGQNFWRLSRGERKSLRPRLQAVFQDPAASLNPRQKIEDLVTEPLRLQGVRRKEAQEEAEKLIQTVGLSVEVLRQFPHQLSGGQRQRVALARALISRPKVIVLDEPTSALDVSVQAQILDLLEKLKSQRGLSYLFISHDLPVVLYMSDRVGVMYLGELLELGPREVFLHGKLHPYTELLLSSIPGRRNRRIPYMVGEGPSFLHLPSGCVFHPRCPEAVEICGKRPPELREIAPGHRVACHRR